MKKLLLLTILLISLNPLKAMMPPALFLIPLDSKPEKPDKLTRKWLNWVYAQNSAITSSNQVRSNLDYYHEMIKTHYNYLLHKKQNSRQIKNYKKKILTIASGINAAIWSIALYNIIKAHCSSDYYDEQRYDANATISVIAGIISAIPQLIINNSYQKYDHVLESHLQRDLDMLKQFEEYKAIQSK